MQQLTYTAPRTLEWQDAQPPSLDSDGAALVRPLAVATCDLDALIVAGVSPFEPPSHSVTSASRKSSTSATP